MKNINLKPLIVLVCCMIGFTGLSQTTIINYGSSWSYYDNQQEPPAQGGTEWEDLNYDDSSWQAGNTHMGYGDGDEVTPVNPNTLTLYVRHEFNVATPSNYDSLNLNLTYDDGAVVYLNGVELWRVNMPTGTITYNTFTPAQSSDNASAATVVANSLLTGNNVLAVEIHQRSSSSSDISFDFELSGNAPGAVNVIRGPYLQKGTPSSVVIKWRTATPTESVVDYGTSLGNLNQNVSDLTAKTEHEIELTGLLSDTQYYYEISNSAAVLIPEASDVYFNTHPVSGSTQLYRFWVLGDPGTANNNQRAVRNAYYNFIGTDHTDGILFLGDNAYNDGTDTEYQTAMFQNMYEDKLKNTIAWSTLGNHDGHSADSNTQTGPYYDIFTFPKNGESGGMASGTEAYYSFDYGNVHFIVLESYETDRSVGGAMYNWCQSDIQNTTQDWIVALWHHPAYSKGSHNSDTEGPLIDMRQNFLPLLEANGVDLVLSGHSHSYERSYFLNGHYGNSGTFNSSTHTIGANGFGDGQISGTGAYVKTDTGPDAGKGAVYITAGSSGKISGGSLDHNAMYYSVSQLGSCVVEVDGNELTVKFVRETGAIEDFFTVQKGCTTVGQACDDGDPCTTNDVYDANCDCAGTPEPDSDGDGVCDALDQCPGQDDALIGTACDDGDSCTDNDTYDANCGCVGTPVGDSDGDGVCDTLDQCPGQDDALIGTACDDGDACTTNDTYDANCGCVGTPEPDSDGDGVCDALDQCPGLNDNLIGTSCDDGDPCTENDTYDANCGCVGTPVGDSDGDGVCDTLDQCPGQDDALIGTSCDDGDVCTDNDVYDANCNCAGTPSADNDGDGYCANEDPNDNDPCTPDPNAGACDPCTDFTVDGFESGFGNWNDGGNDAARVASNANTGTYSIRIRDNSGASSSTFSDSHDFSLYDEIRVEFSYFPNSMENGEDFFLEISSNGGSSYSNVQTWVSGTHFSNGVRENESVVISGPFTATTVLRFRNDASGNNDQIFLDDIVLRTCAVSCTAGATCDDGDACTENDVYDANCDCAGTPVGDSDGDGVCDAEDQCPGQDDALIGTSCDDGDACTTSDIYDANCNCAGTYEDKDGDGLCVGDDPDDNDGCNPDPNSPACAPCGDIINDGFESGFGNWNDGGNDAARVASNANTGSYSIRLRDNSGASSSMSSDVLDLSSYAEVSFDFSYITNSMENNEDFFLEVSSNGGSSYTTLQTWASGTDFNNNTRYNESVLVSGPFTNSMVFRLRCDASANNDQVYIDDVVISDCTSPPTAIKPQEDNSISSMIKVYPNPVSKLLYLECSAIEGTKAKVSIMNIYGQEVQKKQLNGDYRTVQEINMDGLADGFYLLIMTDDQGKTLLSKQIIVKN